MNEAVQPLIVRILEQARRGVLLIALLGVALHLDATASDASAPKWLWLGVAGGLLPALAALRLWWGGRLRLAPPRILGALLVMAVLVTAAYLASPYRAVSTSGWQSWLMSLLIFLAAVDLMAEEGGRAWALRALVLAGGLAGAWSVAQRLGLDTTEAGRLSVQAFGSRVAGSLGNPNFAGGFFVLLLPVLLLQAVAGATPWLRRGASLAALLVLLGLGLSASKAAAFGLLASLAVAAHLVFWSDADSAAKKQIFYGFGALILAGLLAALLLMPGQARQRLLGGPTAWEESVSFRRITWAGTLDMARARPVLGWGPGAFSVAYPAYRLPEAMKGQAQHSYEVTHPENWVLQLLSELGVLGLAGFGVLLYFLLWPLRLAARAWSDDEDAALGLAVLSALLGSLACNLASLDLFLPSTLLPFLVLAALGTVLSAGRSPSISLNPENYARLLVSFGLAFMATVPIVHGQLRWQSSRYLAEGRALSQQAEFAKAVPLYQAAVDLDPLNLEARYFLARSLQDQGGEKWADAQLAFQDLAQLAPDYVLIHASRARLYASQGRMDLAEAEWKRQLKIDPYLLQGYQELGSLLAMQGRLAEALALLEDAKLRFPDQPDIHVNLEALRRAQRKGKP